MNAPGENAPNFIDSIELNTPMTPQQAIETLATFHNTSNKAVLDTFRDLIDFKGTVEFTEGINNSTPCISMQGNHPDGKFAWHN